MVGSPLGFHVGANDANTWSLPTSNTDTSLDRSDTALRTDYAYDLAGSQYEITDPRGIFAETLFDMLGRKRMQG